MQVSVLFFGQLKDLLGRAQEQLELPAGATVRDLASRYVAEYPKLKDLLPSVAFSVNREYAAPETPLKHGDEIGLLPPVSGGAPRATIVRDPIQTARIIAEIRRGEDGAVITFEGVVRNHTRGRRTLYLDYEAYEPMALNQMESLVQAALDGFRIRDAMVVHRLGRLTIGETSVLVAVASAHRAAAFEACRYLIDTLKKTVPIWKKEYFEDGAVWADGEPFPESIPTGATGMPEAASK